MGDLEHPLFHRFGDDDAAGEGNEGDFRPFDQRIHRHRGAGRGAAEENVDMIVLDQALGEAVGARGVRTVVVGDELDRTSQQPARGVRLLDIDLQGLQLGLAQEGGRPRHREHRADPDRVGG